LRADDGRRTEDPQLMAEELKYISLHRPGEPWEVARLALYLARKMPTTSLVKALPIDGGLEMNWGQGA
jgi:glucose 1-dehydrogenase